MSNRQDESYRNALLMDLQWFAAEDEGRTEEPSEYKIQKAREEGRVAKSQELISALVLLLPAIAILILAPYLVRNCIELIRFFFTRITDLDPTKDRFIYSVLIRYFIQLVLPIILVALIAAIFANLVQVGFLFTLQPLVPNFSRIIPRFGQYFQRTLFSMEGLFNLGKSVVKMLIIGGVAFFCIRTRIHELANLQTMSIWTGVTLIGQIAMTMLIVSAILLLFLSIPDFMFQRWRYRESLKMSREEVKEERKMYEGDPLIKSRLRQRMRELLTRNMIVNVPKADVVITNPTHYAIALEYQAGAMRAPRLTAKGADELALRIRRVAEESGVPIVENRPLARALYAEVEIGEEVPEAYWSVVATILSRVFALNEERRRAAAESESI